MPKNKKRYNVETEPVTIIKWESLKEANLLIRETVKDLRNKLLIIKVMVEKDLKDSKRYNEITKTFVGVENTFIELLRVIEEVTLTHSKREGNNVSFFSGEVDIKKEDHTSLYINAFTIYSSISEQITAFSNTSMVVLMTEYEELLDELKNITDVPVIISPIVEQMEYVPTTGVINE